MTPITPVKRDDRGTAQGLNPAIVQALFATEPGSIGKQVVPTATGFAIVATDEVIEADPSADAAGVEQLRTQLEAETRNDLLAQFEAALRRDYPVEIDRRGDQPPDRSRGSGRLRPGRLDRPWPRAPSSPSSSTPTPPAGRRWSGPRWSPTSRRRSRRCSSWPRAGPTASCSNRSRAARCAAATRASASSPT